MAEYKPVYKQDQIDSRYQSYPINVKRSIPRKGISGIATGVLGITLIAYGFTKYIIKQKQINAERRLRAEERRELLPIIHEYIDQRDSGNRSLVLNNQSLQNNIKYLQENHVKQPDNTFISSLSNTTFARWILLKSDDNTNKRQYNKQKSVIANNLKQHLEHGVQPAEH